MKLSSLKINSTAVAEGRWIGDLPGLPGVRLHVRGTNNPDWRRLRAKLIDDIPVAERRTGLSIEQNDAIEAELLKQTCLLGWDGFTEDDEKTPIPYSPELAAQQIDDPDYVGFRNAVSYAAGLVAEQRDEAHKVAAGESLEVSAGA